MTMSIEAMLKATPLTDSESNRYASIKRVAISKRKNEEQRHTEAVGAIDAQEMFDLQQLAEAVNRRIAERMEEKYG